MFDRCVAEGRLAKWEYVWLVHLPHRPDVRGIHYIYYMLPGQEWRVHALRALYDRDGPWSAEREREFGALLGYTYWQNDIWAERFSYKSMNSA